MKSINFITFNQPRYRFGYNGMEKVNEWSGIGDYLDFGARGLDSRIGRWQTLDSKGGKYPSLSPYNFAANSPIKFVDFGVTVNHNPENRSVVVTMNVYTVSESAYKQALSGAAEVNAVSATAKINGNDYKMKFQINVVAPSSEAGARSDAENDPIGNFYRGTTDNIDAQQQGDKYSAVGGETKNGWKVQMNEVHFGDDDKTYDIGNHAKQVSHEFLHLMGQDDKGGKYYDKRGRMVYTATRENGFRMKEISAGDVKNILKYAQDYGAGIPVKKAGQKDERAGAQVILKEKGSGNFKWGDIQDVKLDKK